MGDTQQMQLDGESRSMQEQVHDFLEGGENSNLRYFTFLKAQLEALLLFNHGCIFVLSCSL
jgi:hypothetical protein